MRQVVALVVVFLLAAVSASAATYIAPTDTELLGRADLVVVATVLDSAPREGAQRMIYTDHRLHVEEVLKGTAPATLIVSELGGVVNGRGIAVPGAASYAPGTRVVTFLRQRDDGTYFTAFMSLGKYRFERQTLVRDLDGIEVDDHTAYDPRPADEFIAFIRDGAPERGPRPQRIATEARPETPVTNAGAADYVVTGGGKPLRFDCPSACTVNWTVGSPQQGSVNTAEAVEDAMDAWTNEPNAWITLGIGGFNNHTAHTNDDINDLIFNTNDNAGVCDSGLGCGIVYFNGSSDQHTFDGTQFYDIISSDVLIRPVNFSQAFFEAVLAHELGHAIGFKHAPTSGNLMSTSIASNSNASLKSWDREAVSEVYGNGLPCVAPTIASTGGAGSVPYGETKQLSVNVAAGTSTPISYQWYRGNPPDTTNQVGGNSDKYTTPAITVPATFWVKVTNACGSVNSNAITVTPQPCTQPSITTQPQSTKIAPGATATLSVAASGTAPLTYRWYQSNTVGDESTLVGNQQQFTTPALNATTSYWVKVSNNCGSSASALATITVGNACVAPSIVLQPNNVTVNLGEGVTLGVSAAGDAPFSYQWYTGDSGDDANPIQNQTGSSLNAGPFNTPGTHKYWVKITNACGSIASATITLTVNCGTPVTPNISAPAATHASATYDVRWTGDLAQSSAFELQEALNDTFTSGLRSYTVTGAVRQQIPAHTEITADTRFFYRVRAISSCTGTATPYSATTSTIITAPQPANSTEFSISVPQESTQPFTQNYLVPGFGETATNNDTFAITTDASWLTVFPQSGALSAGGTTVQLTIHPTSLDVGTTTATVVVQRTNAAAARGPRTNAGTSTTSLPFSISKVTPVTPAPRGAAAPEGTLIIPAVAHADGIGTRFQSDVRIANASSDAITYELTYTPSRANGTEVGKKTTLTIGPNENKGLDDIVKAWYGAGVLNEAGLGTLEIRPLGNANPLATFASSRTYAISSNGTLGQFIPALGLDKFVGSIAADPLAKISLQQIANSTLYRTNLGFVEGTGTAVTYRATLRDAQNNILKTVERTLPAYGHEQTSLEGVFGAIAVNDGRVEVEVVSGGKVTAYASVIDNQTSDPLLVFPVQAAKIAAQHFVVPGVAELDNGTASNFHTDMRIFNGGATPVTVTLNYHPQFGDATPRPQPAQVTIGAFETHAVDNVLPSVWGLLRTGGAVTVDAPGQAPLVLTARTYSRDAENGTYGQFIPGVTASDAVGNGERALQILQLEQSDQYRTNLGLVEVTGNPVTIEITATTGSKATAAIPVTLAGHEFRQIGRVFGQMGIGGAVYNGRISVKVIGGTGRIAAYGSVVDNRTVDPTYVPAQ
ncbi:MAG TPA: matrixin family metalloprotease [Thermoanaerobaculia bacterium]|nr:matrixin family metalloprotease [Thermoanaerobaculia bacterium]